MLHPLRQIIPEGKQLCQARRTGREAMLAVRQVPMAFQVLGDKHCPHHTLKNVCDMTGESHQPECFGHTATSSLV